MVDRNVRVRLSLDPHNFISGLGKSAFAARAFAKSLGDSDGRLAAFNKSLDATRDSTSMLIRAGIAIGPALVPALAAATPAAFGLAAGLTAAATGGAVAALALNGVGDALGALNDYQLDPSIANLEKVRAAFVELSPAAREFTLFLDNAAPALDRLQSIAAEGALPGFQEGIDDLLDGLPVFERLVDGTATALGRLASQGGDALANDPFWQEFTEFIANEAGPTLELYGQVLGNFAKTFAGMVMAFDPLADDFNDSLLRTSERLADWGASLSDSEGFQEFVDYVRESGPEVADALGSIANLILQLVQAAAPVGSVMLPIIGGLADALAAIADSPAGPVLIGVASGLSAIASVKALASIASLQAIGAFMKGGAKDGEKAGAGFRAAAAGVGVFGLAVTDIDDKMGIANTSMGALIGLMATGGPWGAAIGGAIGLTADLSKTNDDLRASFDRLTDSLDPNGGAFDLTSSANQLADFRNELSGMRDELTSFGLHSFKPGNVAETWEGIFGTNDLEEFEEEARVAQQELASLLTGLNEIRHGLSGSSDPMAGYTNSLSKLQETASQVIPALQEIGYSQDEIKDALSFGGEIGTDEVIADLKEYFAFQDSMAGRSQGVSDAIGEIGEEALSAAAGADQLAAALDALFGPELGLSEATDAWIGGLKDLKNQIDQTNPTLRGNTQAALQNREAIRGVTTNLIDQLNAEAAAGASKVRISRLLQSGRQNILKFADAAGIGRKQTAAFLREIGLTPKLVRMVIDANITERQQQMEQFRSQVAKLPKEVITRLMTPGAVESRADVVRLARELELTPEQKKILLGIIDNASGGLAEVKRLLDSLYNKTVTITTINRAVFYNEYITTHRSGGPLQSMYNADGNIVRNGRVMAFANGAEDHRAMIGRPGDIRVWNEPEAGGESYIPLDPSKRKRSLDIWAMTGRLLGVEGFADGDVVGKGKPKPLGDKFVNEIVRDLRDQFGKNSPIVAAIERWLQRIDKADFSQKELNQRIRELARGQADPILRQFRVGPRQDASETRSEIRELVGSLRETYGPDSRVARMAQRRGEHLMDVARRQDKAAAKHERAVDKFDRIQDRQRDFMQSVRQAFTHDAFAADDINNRGNSITQLRADANDAARVTRQFRRLDRLGLNDAIIRQLAQSGNYSLIRSLSGSSRGEIRRYEMAFNRRNRNLRELGLVTGRQVFGDEMASQRRVVARTERTLRHVNRTMTRLPNQMERAIVRGVRQGFDDRNQRQRRRRRSKSVR